MMLPVFMNSAARMNSGIGQQQLACHHAIQQLLSGRSHVEARQEQPENGAPDHRVGDGQPDQAQPDYGDERE
jgi:hypothetical protein